jgi:predicted PurR-regulated permease PerM
MRIRTVFFLVLAFICLVFLYYQRAILTPFIIAAIFAYIFNPLVNFFSHKIKLPRTLSVIIIYVLIVSIISACVYFIAQVFIAESNEFRSSINTYISNARSDINLLPFPLRNSLYQTLESLRNADFLKVDSLFSLFPRAFTGLISLIIFLVSSFYFLKEGKGLMERLLVFVPKAYKIEVEILLRKINTVLGGYLRGQIFIVIFLSFVLFIALSILGVKFALILAVFSGIAEIIPWIGPIVATVVAVVSILLTGGSSTFHLPPVQTAIIVVIIYFVVRQIQDYLIMPHILGRITKLHPVVVLFAVLVGEHSAGILGLLLAVPVAAVLKILLEFSVDTINDQDLVEQVKKKS